MRNACMRAGNVISSFLVATLALSGVATYSCLSNGKVDYKAVGVEIELSAVTLRDVAALYADSRPALYDDLVRVAELCEAAGEALQSDAPDDVTLMATAAMDLAESLLASEDDPDVQAALIVARAGLARVIAYAPHGGHQTNP